MPVTLNANQMTLTEDTFFWGKCRSAKCFLAERRETVNIENGSNAMCFNVDLV